MQNKVNKSLIILLYVIIFTIVIYPCNTYSTSLYWYENGGLELYDGSNFAKELYDGIKFDLPLKSGNIVPGLIENGYPINFRLWKQKGLLVYGRFSNVSISNDFKLNTQTDQNVIVEGDGYFYGIDTKTGMKGRGEWRYLGYDVSGNPFSNIHFINEGSGIEFCKRNWIVEPWKNLPADKKTTISNYNKTAILTASTPQEIAIKAKTIQWINAALPQGVPMKTGPDNPEVYNYLNILSAPTISLPGQGRMWHKKDDGSIWYQTLSVPKLSPAETPVDVNIQCLLSGSDLTFTDTGTSSDNREINLRFKVTATLKDESYYNDEVAKRAYYTRSDIKSWNITFNPDKSLSDTPPRVVKTNVPTVGNKGTCEFTYKVTCGYLKGKNLKEFVTAAAQPVFKNNHMGPAANTNLTTDFTKLNPAAHDEIPAATPEQLEPVKDIFTPLNNIPETAFDGVGFAASDFSDLSKVEARHVYVDGVEVNGEQFFSGNYIFQGNTGVNGRFALVEVEYLVDELKVFKLDTIKTVDYVYIYPTKPIANFNLSSTSWKQNRLIKALDMSAAGNIQIVQQKYPIDSWEWSISRLGEKGVSVTNTKNLQEFYFKEPGIYSVSLKVRNTLGKWSDPQTTEFEVLEDIKPAIELNLNDSVTARGEEIKAWHYSVASTDGDIITSCSIELWYDSDNNGTVDTKLNTWDGTGAFPVYTPKKLGYYKYIITAREDFGETKPPYITDSDKKIGSCEVEFWVDNYQPMADIFLNVPVQRPNIDVFFILDEKLEASKRDYLLNNKMNIANWLVGKNIIPNVNIWDMHTYSYSQPASTSINTGSSYPPETASYTSNGYTGSLSRTSVGNNQYSRDEGKYVTGTESKTVSVSDSESGCICFVCYPSGIPAKLSTTAPYNYTDSYGFSGTLPLTYNYSESYSGTYCTKHTWQKKSNYQRTWYWSGTVTRSVSVWEPNIVWYNNYTGYYSGTIYKNVQQPYVDPFQSTSEKYVVYISDNTISRLEDLKSVMGKSDAKLYVCGTSAIKGQIPHYKYYDSSGSSIENLVDSVLQDIAMCSPSTEKVYLLQNEPFTMNLGSADIEKDNIIKKEMQYVQNDCYFDNPTGRETGTQTAFISSYGWTANVAGSFSNVGCYEIYRRVKDLPSSAAGFLQYSYYSSPAKVEIYVHRKPIAKCSLDWDFDAAAHLYKTKWVDLSYDLDHNVSRADKGIADRKIMYRPSGGEWIYTIPDSLVPGTTYELQYFVKDIEGAWSDPYVMTFTADNIPDMQLQARLRAYEYGKYSLTGIPASENIEFYHIKTRYPFNLALNLGRITNAAIESATARNIPFTNGTTGIKSGNDINWNNVVYKIPSTLRDGSYTYRIEAVADNGTKGYVDFPVTVKTPVGLLPQMPSTATAGESILIKASTSKYVNSTQVTLYSGTAYKKTYSMVGLLSGDTKNWALEHTVPANIPDGVYMASFLSTTPNGNSETRQATIRIESLKITGVSITGYWNHWRGQTDLFGRTMSSQPHRFLSLETVKIDVNTTGYADKVVIRFSPELEAMKFTDANGNTYNYADQIGYSVDFPEDSTFTLDNKVNTGQVHWEYSLPLAPSSLSWQDKRLRTCYSMTITVYKGGKSVSYTVSDIDITGNIYDLTYIQPVH